MPFKANQVLIKLINYVQNRVCRSQQLGYVEVAPLYSWLCFTDSYPCRGSTGRGCPLVLESLPNFYGPQSNSIGLYQLVSRYGYAPTDEGKRM